MISMIRIIFTLIFITSCGYVSFNQIRPSLELALFGADDININQEYIDAKSYSFAKVKIGRTAVAILSLASIEDEVFLWKSSNGIRIYTYHGKIIKTEGLNHDYEMINYSGFSKNPGNVLYDVMLYNPKAFIEQESKIYLSQSNIIEEISTLSFRWRYTNSYKYDQKGLVVYSKQKVHPNIPEIEIYFFYK